MNELTALCWSYAACALWLGSDRVRGLARWPVLQTRPRARAAQAAAVTLAIVATLRWNASEPGPAAFIAVPMALMACGTAVTLLGAAFPRAVAASALAVLAPGVVLWVIGAAHG